MKTQKTETVLKMPARGFWLSKVHFGKIGIFVTSLFLFILAITLMKNGSRGLAPFLTNALSVTNPVDSLGFGWLFAYIVMSGSPVAAASLTFFDAGVISELATLAMITGSRLGASFLVLFIGFLYILRGRDRDTSLSMGLLSLTVTATTYLPGLFLGAFFLYLDVFDSIQLHAGAILLSAIDLIFNPIAKLVSSLLTEWAVFLVGLGVIMVSFTLFDRCLPEVVIKDSKFGWISRLIYKPWVMFTLGAIITLVSMSVSLSLSILVPLSTRGYIRRENAIPYIMGANITTFIDTLFAALLLNNPLALTVVLIQIFSITIVSVIILLAIYSRYHQAMIQFEKRVVASNSKLSVFVFAIVFIPVVLLLIK